MNLNLDEKRIRKIIYTLEDGTVVAYNFRNGEIWCTQDLGKLDNKKTALTDHEMIDALKKSDFMDELANARKRFKIAKEIADEYPEVDEETKNYKRGNDKVSTETLKAIQKIIELDKNGVLDDIVKKRMGIISNKLTETDEYKYSEEEYDAVKCQNNMDVIEKKLLAMIRNGKSDTDEFKKLLDDFYFYQGKERELINKTFEKPKEDERTE